jgi:hypothetical protein
MPKQRADIALGSGTLCRVAVLYARVGPFLSGASLSGGISSISRSGSTLGTGGIISGSCFFGSPFMASPFITNKLTAPQHRSKANLVREQSSNAVKFPDISSNSLERPPAAELRQKGLGAAQWNRLHFSGLMANLYGLPELTAFRRRTANGEGSPGNAAR